VTVSFADGLDRIIQTKKSLARDPGSGVQIGMAVSGPVVHDDQGRLNEQNQPYFDTSPPSVMAPSPASPVPLRKVEYDALDRAVTIRTPLSPNAAGPDPYNYATATTVYTIGKINANSRLQATVADPNVNGSTAGNPLPGYQRVELSGIRGNLLQVIEKNRLADSSTPSTLPTHYGYNALGELMSVTDAKGNVTRATYDTLGRLVTLISPDAGRIDYLFDLSGNLAAKQTANLAQGFQYVRYEYEHNRLIEIDYPNSPDVTYEYGAWEESGPIGYYRASRIKQETSEAGTKSYQYDPLGNVNEETWTLNRIGSSSTIERTFAYDYDSFGRLLAVYYPGASAEVVSYGYDAGGKLDTVTGVTASGATMNYVQHIGYDEFEQKTLVTVGNGITTRYTYNPLTRLLAAVDTSHRDPALVQAGAPARPFQQLRFQYDPVGNINQIANIAPYDPAQTGAVKVGPVTENFTYDDLYQLRTADGLHQTSAINRYHYGLSFSYDLISNVTSKAQVSETQTLSGSTVVETTTRTDQTYTSGFTYPTGGRPHAPTEVSDTVPGSSTPVKRAFTYDRNGNQSAWQRTTGTPANRQVTYNDDNRATGVTQNGVTLQEALYDGEGERLVKRANGSAYTAYFGQYLTVRSSVPSTKHIYAGDLRVASKFVPNDANEECTDCPDRASVTYFHGDQLGSTTFATGEVQNLVAHEQYFPSGELWVDQTNDPTHARQPYLFSGKELDVETGLYNYGARQYDPRLSLWTTPDPILDQYMRGAPNSGAYFPRNLALYTYAINNPIAVRDVDGQAWWTKVLKVGKAIYKGGDMAMTFADTIQDFNTVIDPNASTTDRLLAGASLLTEIAPISVSDFKDAGRIIGVVDEVADTRQRARQAETAANAAKATKSGPPPCTGTSCGGPGVCFVAGTLVSTEQGQVPIEQLRLGDRVNAGNPECAGDHISPDARTIHLQVPNPYQPLDVIQLQVVRPLTWLSAMGFDGGQAWLELNEVGVSGRATVTSIGPAPEEEPGHGCLVLTTLEHVASEVLRVRLSGTAETLELTPTHQLYVEGTGWTAARTLSPGVYLRTDRGPIAIDAIETAQPNQRVYNIEVGREHTYRVAGPGVWAHNECPEGGGNGTIYLRRDKATGEEYVGQAGSGRYDARKGEHAAKHPDKQFEFDVLEEAGPGRNLDVAEEDWIRAGGGPQRFGGPLANDRYQMSDKAYKAAGGNVPKPTE
jgi:RHS repeat-associated protein